VWCCLYSLYRCCGQLYRDILLHCCCQLAQVPSSRGSLYVGPEWAVTLWWRRLRQWELSGSVACLCVKSKNWCLVRRHYPARVSPGQWSSTLWRQLSARFNYVTKITSDGEQNRRYFKLLSYYINFISPWRQQITKHTVKGKEKKKRKEKTHNIQ